MSSASGWLSLIALAGWLILALAAFRAHRLGGRRTAVLVLAWGAIFLLATAIVSAIRD